RIDGDRDDAVQGQFVLEIAIALVVRKIRCAVSNPIIIVAMDDGDYGKPATARDLAFVRRVGRKDDSEAPEDLVLVADWQDQALVDVLHGKHRLRIRSSHVVGYKTHIIQAGKGYRYNGARLQRVKEVFENVEDKR